MPNPTIIITGGAGYIGSHTLIELLSLDRYDLVSLDNYSNSSAATYDRIREITGRNVAQHQVDITDYAALKKAVEGYSNLAGVIHFAAFKSVPESVADPVLYYRNNIDGLLNMLQLCKEQNIRNFIFSSSCSVYGNVETLPVTEDTPLSKAESPYAHTKQVGEDIVRHFCVANPDFKAVLLRYFNPVGAHTSGLNGELPTNRPNNLVPVITQTAAGKIPQLTIFGGDYDTRDGSCIRDYIHVTDIADAHIKALNYIFDDQHKQALSVFNLGTGDGVTVLEAIHSFEKISGLRLNYVVGPRRSGDVVAIYANRQLAKQELNWEPKFGLDEMMRSAWKWQQHVSK